MLTAIKYYGKALPFLFKHKLGHFLLYPFLITVLVIWGGASATTYITELLTTAMHQWFEGYSFLPEWAAWITDVIYWIVWLIFKIILYFAMAFVGGSIILLLMSPVLTFLSEKVAIALGKEVPTFSIAQFTTDLLRAAGLALKNGAIQLGLTLPCLVIGLIPVIGIAAPFLLFGINAYFFGYNFMDYTLERYQFSISQSNRFVFGKKLKAIGLGSPFTAWLLIPFIGAISSGFMAVIATVAATLYLEESRNTELSVKD